VVGIVLQPVVLTRVRKAKGVAGGHPDSVATTLLLLLLLLLLLPPGTAATCCCCCC
jgi:hypothetical protein